MNSSASLTGGAVEVADNDLTLGGKSLYLEGGVTLRKSADIRM
jgi:hypothetical protein